MYMFPIIKTHIVERGCLLIGTFVNRYSGQMSGEWHKLHGLDLFIEIFTHVIYFYHTNDCLSVSVRTGELREVQKFDLM